MTGLTDPASAAPAILPLGLEGLVFAAGGKTLIKGITATLSAGSRSIVLGPNGAGKTLLLRLCHGLIPPTGGRIVWKGAAGADPALRQAMVFQRPVMLRRSVAANVDYALRLRDLARADRQQRIEDVLTATGLRRFATQPARLLSVGEQQKLALARAWALRPDVLFLDEPTASLDPAATRAVEEIILRIDAGGTKIIMSTHDLAQARRVANEVLFLHRGRLCEQTPAPVFFTAPRTAEAGYFLEGKLFPQLRRINP
ncbi:MAG: ATP-binding cassette domain-containing protein [Rhodospirillales bacterium]|nr:ATP-binding cassette domain-containing protein [Rhodospirillales bacterium]